MTMLKGAWILPAVMFVALLVAALFPMDVFAADRDEFRRSQPTYFRNLPGVVPEEERVRRDSYTCSSDIEYVYRPRGRYDILYGDVAPTRIYRCRTEGGATFSGTDLPNTQWVPGLNPRHLPE
ncbi:hypothetical protein [Neorhizobium petrolearium]|uniref:Secreted protein n=1 Tax=Neorhizobium petrolearium TaxID=515361 RepID=A0ABY8M1E6_9HYPH|nr:hypothetical protein [Neorhizobium petrolearium]MCC2613299.1 hypothetical protein [Neorhizobium petrolearium]WGI68386.1 hypothetical protein QEO92_26100 [Neorhizobium petrolearium]